jgi:NAD(P)-dependent dehydrogenase (short-subunit alcohol dehydrogenase family)
LAQGRWRQCLALLGELASSRIQVWHRGPVTLTLSPTGQIAAAQDIAEAVFYLTQASQVTGETLHVDGGAQLGRW